MKLALLLLAVSACGPAHEIACRSKGGLTVIEPVPAGWCDELQAAEDDFIRAAKLIAPVDERFATPTKVFPMFKVHVVAAESWKQAGSGLEITGETRCDAFTICLNNKRPPYGSLGHELAHAVQLCSPKAPYDFKDIQHFYHSNWAPIYTALNREFP